MTKRFDRLAHSITHNSKIDYVVFSDGDWILSVESVDRGFTLHPQKNRLPSTQATFNFIWEIHRKAQEAADAQV